MIHPAPKPKKVKRSRRGPKPRAYVARHTALPKKKQRPRPVNAKRKAREFRRTYHSLARVEFVKSLPCASCGVFGWSQNAHATGGGAGRKSGYAMILALCGPGQWMQRKSDGKRVMYEGCHRLYDEHRLAGFTLDHALAAAARTEKLWLASHPSTENA